MKTTKRASPKTIPAIISIKEAQDRCAGGMWITDDVLNDRIANGVNRCFDSLRHECPEIKINSRVLIDAFAVIREIASQKLQSAIIASERFTSATELRIAPCIAYKVVPTIVEALTEGLTIILVLLSASDYTNLTRLRSLAGMAKIVKILYDGWEKIQDPDERLVFEEIHRLSTKAVLLNHDAYAMRDFQKAYGYRAPTTPDLAAALGTRISTSCLEKTLLALEKGKIIRRSKKGGWIFRI
jgi:hypothetical protein